MWRLTPEGRRLLQGLAARHGGRIKFAAQLGIGKNQIKPLLDNPDHPFNQATCEKLCRFVPEFKEGAHYTTQADSEGCEIRLARDRLPDKNLSHRDQQGIVSLYDALCRNPRFHQLHPVLDPLEDFEDWFEVWGSSGDQPGEQFFVYRVLHGAVIAFLAGELRQKKRRDQLGLFAIWYLVGTRNAFYPGSPVQLTGEAARQPIGDLQSATQLSIRLLEELRELRGLDYLFFEIEAAALNVPDSLGRRLLRVYSYAEKEVREHFAYDAVLRDCQCFVLDFPHQVPQWDAATATVKLKEHRLICCPLNKDLLPAFKAGRVPLSIAKLLLATIYQMYWDYFDADAPQRAAIQQATQEALAEFRKAGVANGGQIAALALREFIASGFRGKTAGISGKIIP